MQHPEEQSAAFLRLNVWAVTLSSALTALIVLILSFPLHLMHQRSMAGARGGGADFGAPHPMMGGDGISVAFVLIALLLALVYGGVAGAIFASLYNAILNRR